MSALSAPPTVHIPAATRALLARTLTRIDGNPYAYESRFSVLARIATNILADLLEPDLVNRIRALAGSYLGFLEITGTPSDPEPIPTPAPEQALDVGAVKRTFVPELFSMGIAGLMGQEVFNFRQEGWGTGALIFNIVPRADLATIRGAGGTVDNFRFHMENAWHPQAPDALLLKGIRQDHDAAAVTYVVANATLRARLSPADLDVLRKPIFEVNPPEIHRRMELEKGILFNADRPYIGPVLVEDGGRCKLVINFNGMEPVRGPDRDRAALALERMEAAARELATEFKLSDDNLLVVVNNRSIHTRNGYTPRFDGRDRWIQRYYLLEPQNLWRSLPVRGDDFENLDVRERAEVMAHLYASRILDGGSVLTRFFSPYEPGFGLVLPDSLVPKRKAILRTLLDKGPAFPHRMV